MIHEFLHLDSFKQPLGLRTWKAEMSRTSYIHRHIQLKLGFNLHISIWHHALCLCLPFQFLYVEMLNNKQKINRTHKETDSGLIYNCNAKG